MATIIKSGTCCTCCAMKVANDDTSGCRDFFEHQPHEPQADGFVVIDGDEPEVFVGPCDLCKVGPTGYTEGYSFVVFA